MAGAKRNIDQSKECVVIAVMGERDEIDPTVSLPGINNGESCDQFYLRCRSKGALKRFVLNVASKVPWFAKNHP